MMKQSVLQVFIFCIQILVMAHLGYGVTLPDLYITSSTSSTPFGIAIDPITRSLFVAEFSNNRVLRYQSIDTITASSTPIAVLGQPNFTALAATYPPTASSLSSPRGIAIDSTGTLWVADTSNARVLWWKNAGSLPSGSPADGVIGQTSFTSTGAALSAGGLSSPGGLTVDDGILWVADQSNSRILRYDDVASPSFPTFGALANGVIGKLNFTSNGGSSGPAGLYNSINVLKAPNGGLYISDMNNYRVLYYTDAQARLTGAAASFAYGQSDLQANSFQPASEFTLGLPVGLTVAPDGSLFVTDASYHRVLLYPPGPGPNGVAASTVFGQPNFTTSSMSLFNYPLGVAYDEVTNCLWISDTYNNRVLRYSNVLVKPVVNNPSSTVDVVFKANTPQVSILPKDSLGQTQPGQREFFLQPTLIEEIDANGVVVSSSSFPSGGYTVNTSSVANVSQTFTFSASSPIPVTITYTLFEVAQTLNSAGVTFSLNSDALKFELLVGQWSFASSANRLRVHLYLTIQPNVTEIQQIDYTDTATFICNSNNSMTSYINLIRSCVVDGSVNAPVSFSLVNTGGNSLDLMIDLPYFGDTVLYDPDFSVALGGSSLGTGGDDSGSADSDLTLLALISLIVIPAAFLLVAVGVTSFVCIRRHRMRSKLTSDHSQSL